MPIYNIRPTTEFRGDLERVKKRGFDISLLTDIIKKLAAGKPLPETNRDHQLSGDYVGYCECRISPDWLLIYESDGDELFFIPYPVGITEGFILEDPPGF